LTGGVCITRYNSEVLGVLKKEANVYNQN